MWLEKLSGKTHRYTFIEGGIYRLKARKGLEKENSDKFTMYSWVNNRYIVVDVIEENI